MDMTKHSGSKFLKAADLDGDEVRVTIERIEETTFKDGKEGYVMFFTDWPSNIDREARKRGMSLNATNTAKMVNGFQTKDGRKWIGRQVILYEETVQKPDGTMGPAIRVRVPKDQKGDVAAPRGRRDDTDEDEPRPPAKKYADKPLEDEIPF